MSNLIIISCVFITFEAVQNFTRDVAKCSRNFLHLRSDLCLPDKYGESRAAALELRIETASLPLLS